MRAVSNRFARKLADNSNMLVKASVKFADGTKKELTGDDFCAVSVESACSSAGSFDIGAAIIGKLECTLNNYDDRFSEYDFQDAEIIIYVGERFEDGETEWIRLGTYWCDQPDSYAGQIQISALDCLHKLEGKADVDSLVWPTTVAELADTACRRCGLLGRGNITNGDYVISEKPEMNNASWLDLIGYAAQLACCFVTASADGRVVFKWHDTDSFEKESWLDGGEFDESSPYSTGDKADGGDFTDYSTGVNADGGTFFASNSRVIVSKFSQLTVCTDDVVITGVSVTASNEVLVGNDGKRTNGADGETALYGAEGYVLSISGNPLVLFGHAAEVASMVGKHCVGMRFRPFSADIVTDPSIEVGDAAVVIDRKGNEFRSYVTNTTINVNGSMSIGCEAKSPGRNAAEKASAATKAIVAARNDLKREQTARELAYKGLQDKVAESSGLFTTRQTLADGSTVTFMHDRADLASSRVIWKMTAEALAVSTDGGKTYATGLTADGTALLNRIYTIGLNADYITTGTLDANRVSIRNMMGIGNSEAHILIDGRQIGFFSGQKPMLGISYIPYSIKTFCTFAYDGVLFENTSGKPGAKPVSFSLGVPFEKVFYKSSSGKYANRFGYTIKWCRGTDPYKTFKTSIEESEFDQIPSANMSNDSPYGEFAIGITKGEDGNAQLTIRPGSGNPVAGKIKAIDFFYSVESPSVNISTPGDKVLTAENLTSVLRDHYDSYCLSLPFVYGNSMKNVLMYFVGGLMAKLEVVTPTSDAFYPFPIIYDM